MPQTGSILDPRGTAARRVSTSSALMCVGRSPRALAYEHKGGRGGGSHGGRQLGVGVH